MYSHREGQVSPIDPSFSSNVKLFHMYISHYSKSHRWASKHQYLSVYIKDVTMKPLIAYPRTKTPCQCLNIQYISVPSIVPVRIASSCNDDFVLSIACFIRPTRTVLTCSGNVISCRPLVRLKVINVTLPVDCRIHPTPCHKELWIAFFNWQCSGAMTV